MLTVTLDIFSGRPNPRWQLSPKDVQQLVDRVTADPSLLRPWDPTAGMLGYRGFILDFTDTGDNADPWKKAKLPYKAHIGGKHLGSKGIAPAQWLLQTA